MKKEVGDILIDLDFALSKIGVMHRDMEMADAHYMVNKHNEMINEGRGIQED
ncbi:MAG: hypothetical protein WCQ59_08685 [Candidatus Cloacimonadaceae bacterium]|jgi:hypothetical protein